jgi:hypothetical protein
MSKIALSSDPSGTGTFTIASPNSNTNRTLTLPDEAGTILTNGSPLVLPKGVPAFSAYMGSNQTVTNVTFTKLQMNTEVFDTNNNYDPVTNFRFTPTVAGYYSVIASCTLQSTTATHRVSAYIYRNGVSYKGGVNSAAGGLSFPLSEASTILYMNGSSDFVEAYVYIDIGSGTGTIFADNSSRSQFSGVLVGAA